ncbi:MAG: RHS repeat protein [Elusimicrobia bacterium]|nr:RHS repeat protein [Elusimicrobiota bacterium]
MEFKDGNLASEKYTYDRTGRILSSVLGGGINKIERYYEDKSSRTIITDVFGAKTIYHYKNEAGKKLATENYNISATTDALKRHTLYERNNNGDPVKITNALGQTTSIEYQVKRKYKDFSGEKTDYYSRPTSITDALGRTAKFDYDKYGNLKTVTSHRSQVTSEDTSSIPSPLASILYSYDKAGHMLSMKDAIGSVHKYEYGKYGALSRAIDPLGNAVLYEHDEQSQITKITDPLGRKTNFVYDLSGNVIETTNAMNFKTKFSYGSGACPSCAGSQITALTDPKGNTWKFNHDKYGL